MDQSILNRFRRAAQGKDLPRLASASGSGRGRVQCKPTCGLHAHASGAVCAQAPGLWSSGLILMEAKAFPQITCGTATTCPPPPPPQTPGHVVIAGV